jgi:hypothetical protein
MPPPGASPSAIDAAERRLGFAIPPSYRAFLEVHDGWPGFFHGASLLSAHQLARGTYVNVARMVVGEHAAELESGPPSVASAAATFVPFGIDAQAETIIGWDPSRATGGGELRILMWLNGIGDVAESFESLLDLVLTMLGADIEDRRAITSSQRGMPLARSEPARGDARPIVGTRPRAVRAA